MNPLVLDSMCGVCSILLLELPRHLPIGNRLRLATQEKVWRQTTLYCLSARRTSCPGVPSPPAQPFDSPACTHRYLRLCTSRQRSCLPLPFPLPGALAVQSARGVRSARDVCVPEPPAQLWLGPTVHAHEEPRANTLRPSARRCTL